MTDHFLLRATESREVLYCNDPVLHEVALERPFAVREYFATRRIDVLGLTDEQLSRAARFVCEPLRAKYRGIALEGNPVQLRAIFAAHVTEIKGVPFAVEYDTDSKGERVMLDRWVEKFSDEVVEDIVGFIVASANRDGDKIPFSVRDSYVRDFQEVTRGHALNGTR